MDSIFTKLGTIKVSDFWRGFIIAIVMAVMTVIYESIQAGAFDFSWKTVAAAGVGAGLSYLIKNLSTGENGKLLSNK